MKTEDIKKMGQAYLQVLEAAKPDFLDLDKDGNKKEPMKKAAADAKAKKQKKNDGNTEVDVQEAGPKLRPDSLKMMRAHDKAMKPKKEKPMTSTQKALAQVRQKAMGESVQEENISEMTDNPEHHMKTITKIGDKYEDEKSVGYGGKYHADGGKSDEHLKALHNAHKSLAAAHFHHAEVHKAKGNHEAAMDHEDLAHHHHSLAKVSTRHHGRSVRHDSQMTHDDYSHASHSLVGDSREAFKKHPLPSKTTHESVNEMVKPSNTANPAAHKKAAAYHLGQANDHKEALKKSGMETSYYNDHKAAHKAHMAAADSHTGAMRVHKMAGAGDQNRIMDRTVMANKKSEAAKSATQTANESVIYEVSKKTLGSYIKKASSDAAARASGAMQKSAQGDHKGFGKDFAKARSRQKGIEKAVDKLMKKEADDDTVRMYKDNPDMMKKGGPGGLKGLNKSAQRDIKRAVKKESFEIDEASKPTAQHEPDDATRDTYEKQLKTRKGEKDFKDKHKMEVPVAGDEPKIDAINFQIFKNMVKNKDNSRSADQKIGDKSPVKNDGK